MHVFANPVTYAVLSYAVLSSHTLYLCNQMTSWTYSTVPVCMCHYPNGIHVNQASSTGVADNLLTLSLRLLYIANCSWWKSFMVFVDRSVTAKLFQ